MRNKAKDRRTDEDPFLGKDTPLSWIIYFLGVCCSATGAGFFLFTHAAKYEFDPRLMPVWHVLDVLAAGLVIAGILIILATYFFCRKQKKMRRR